ncbi:MAG TPA: DUF5069 domain-containing protein [Verrucomicrobiae bacterium]|jgi:hypothetical protein|nr:DUF5069 domain-containing protein [Verrucomicrobiae bacterium]
MDLTKEYPRSVRERVLGVVQIGRAIDKGKAVAHGNVGEYNFDCPMDQAVFDFLGIEGPKLLEVIRGSKDEAEIEAYVRPFVDKKSPQEIEAWNDEWLAHSYSDESKEYFENLRKEVAPDRTDVTSWADLLDLDEKRPVPVRVAA